MTSFRLINPYIEGSFKKIFTGNSAHDAATEAWNNLSKNFTNNVPKFAFTLEKLNGGTLHHYIVKEKIGNNKMVNYKLTEMDIKNKSEQIKNFKNNLKTIQNGGKKRREEEDDDESSSTSSDEDSESSEIFQKIRLQKFLKRDSPIVYWWYDPMLYNMDYFYMPTFVSTLSPYVAITTSNTYLF